MGGEVREVFQRLAQEYGPRSWYARRDPVGELVFTILSQNTSDGNAFRAFERLTRRFPTWEALAQGESEAIAEAIAVGGLSRIKAPRIKGSLQRIAQERGEIELSFLEEMPLAEAKAWLGELEGVGPKTAACVLMFSFGRPAMPVDTHVYRVARRLGLIGEKVSVEQAHEELEGAVAQEEVYPFHVNLIEHGRRICQARAPRCGECVLNDICPASRVAAPAAVGASGPPRTSTAKRMR